MGNGSLKKIACSREETIESLSAKASPTPLAYSVSTAWLRLHCLAVENEHFTQSSVSIMWRQQTWSPTSCKVCCSVHAMQGHPALQGSQIVYEG